MPSRRDFIAGVAGLAGTAVSSASASAAGAPTPSWERTYAPANRERALISDLVSVVGGFALVGLAGGLDEYRGWVGGVDSAGRSRWHQLKGTGRTAFLAGAPAVGDAGGVVAAGVTNATSDFPPSGYADPYVLRAKPDGEVPWARTYQPAISNGQSSAIASVAGGHVVAGSGAVGDHERPWAASIDGTAPARGRGTTTGRAT